jgi:hypothetical protein
MKRMIVFIRYNLDNRNFKSYVQFDGCKLNAVMNTSTLINLMTPEMHYKPSDDKKSYAYDQNRKPVEIIYSIESSNQEEEIGKIINIINKVDNKEVTRMTECVNNLIDINIIPINFNVLMKDIPLVNLYNYEYTFELMVAKLYNKKHKDFKSKDNCIANINDSQSALLALLYHPYIDLDYGSMNITNIGFEISNRISEYDQYISRIMRGDSNLGLNRPKFLSDQLFNKVLLRSVYPSPSTFDESGIQASIHGFRSNHGYNGLVDDPELLGTNSWLTYTGVDDANNTIINKRQFMEDVYQYLMKIGSCRFETTFIRNLFFIVNVLRITRLKLNRELTTTRNVIVNSHYAVAPSVTEYGNDPFPANEQYASRNMEGYPRYNIND